MATPGDLIRKELAQGASELGLAKRLAGSLDDKDAEVLRYRWVVRRAGGGSEPREENAERIVEVLGDGEPVEVVSRRQRDTDRLAKLEVMVPGLSEAVRLLDERVTALEAQAPHRASEA